MVAHPSVSFVDLARLNFGNFKGFYLSTVGQFYG